MPPRLRSFRKAHSEEHAKLEEEAHMSTETLSSRADRYIDTRGRIAKLLIGDSAIRPPHSQTALTLTDEAWRAFGSGELVVFSEGRRLAVWAKLKPPSSVTGL